MGDFPYSAIPSKEQNGEQGLLIKTEENTYGPPIVRPLILIDGSSLKNVTLDLGATGDVSRFRRLPLGMAHGLLIFSDYGLNSEYYHPFTPQTHWFIAPRVQADNNPLYLYDNNQLTAIYRRTTLGGGVDAGYQFGNTGELRVGYEGGWQNFARQIGNQNSCNRFPVATAPANSSTGWIASTIPLFPVPEKASRGISIGTMPVQKPPDRTPYSKARAKFFTG